MTEYRRPDFGHRCPALAADCVIRFEDGSIVLIERRNDPFKGHWALPGGGIEWGERVAEAAIRETKEETGLDIKIERLIGVYSAPDRDPRGHCVSLAFLATPVGGELRADSDARKAIRTKKYLSMNLAFDHGRIVRDALKDDTGGEAVIG